MEAIAKNLPVDLAKRIFEFQRDWVRTARLTCKAWKVQAEKLVKRIRVNGEFCLLETEDQRTALVNFILGCPSLEVLTLRNVMTLTDDDIARIVEIEMFPVCYLAGVGAYLIAPRLQLRSAYPDCCT